MLRRRLISALAAFAALIVAAAPARAHPHVWVTVKSEIVYAADGAATGVRHRWTFDEMFSTFAIQGMDAKKPGGLTRADLASLAEVNITSLKDFDFFTYARADGKKASFTTPKDYWLDFKDGLLTLNFTLPFEKPVKTKRLGLEIYDPTYFVDFSLDKEGPVTLAGAPLSCKVATAGPRDALDKQQPQGQVDESFFQNLEPGSNWGAQFANRVSVTCP